MSRLHHHRILHWLAPRLWNVLRVTWTAAKRFIEIDAEQSAAAFAYYAFFALFPLILLLVTIGSQFWDESQVVSYVIENMSHYLPFDTSDRSVLNSALHRITDSRGGLGTAATLGLVWSASRFFHALVRGVNGAWGTHEHPWWKLPIFSLLMLGVVAGALLVGVTVPFIIEHLREEKLLSGEGFGLLFDVTALLVPFLILYLGIVMLFRFSPRRRTRFSEVAVPAFVTSVLLEATRSLFAFYVYRFGNFNAVYGAFATVIVLLMWIYVSGVIIIFGGCLCAAGRMAKEKRRTTSDAESP